MATRRKITWGTSFTGSLYPGFLDGQVTYSKPREGTDRKQFASGEEDAWTLGTDYYLEADVRWIPTSTSLSPIQRTGWDNAGGWRNFLEWARDTNQFRWYFNATGSAYLPCYLVEPIDTAPQLEPNGERRIHLVIRNTSSSFNGY